ncbi:MAG: IS200/IS605 family transposase [Spirosomataceae bacterium]
MPNTYTQLYVQLVFAVKNRECLIPSENRKDIQRYITGIIQKRGNKLLAIYAMPDHLHLVIGQNPHLSLSDLVRDIKSVSSKYINEQNWIPKKFHWQNGYGAFSYSRSHIDAVVNYVLNQEEHHKRKTFKEEYLDNLRKYDIDFDEKYVFEWIE